MVYIYYTANSMGRLTLNVLLSFAQFEREVTGERIRDKISASKKKGLWMGGCPPKGYKVEERQLKPIPDEADFIWALFKLYLETPSLLQLTKHFTALGITTKLWTSQQGKINGGKPLTPKYLYRLLTHPVYIGKITHKGKIYDGQHTPIIDKKLWDKVQKSIQRQNHQKQRSKQRSPYLLKGKLRHHQGYAMSPSTSQKKIKGNNDHIKHIRYYVSQKAIKQGYGQCKLKSVNANQIEQLVIAVINQQISGRMDEHALALFMNSPIHKQHEHCRSILNTATISPDKLCVEIDIASLDKLCLTLSQQTLDHCDEKQERVRSNKPILHHVPEVQSTRNTLLITLNVQIKRIDGRRFILDQHGNDLILHKTKPDPVIINALQQAYVWKQTFLDEPNLTTKALAEKLGVNYRILLRRSPLTTLAPPIQYKILTGHLPTRINLKQLIQASALLSWPHQTQFLNL